MLHLGPIFSYFERVGTSCHPLAKAREVVFAGSPPHTFVGVTGSLGTIQLTGDRLGCWHWMPVTGHSQRPPKLSKFCLGLPLSFYQNLVIPHTQRKGEYKPW